MVASLAVLAPPALAFVEEPPPQAEIRSSEVPVSGPWVTVTVACVLPEGSVCSGTIWMSGVAHSIGAGKVKRMSASREIKLLGGEVRPVAIRLLPGVSATVAGGQEKEASVRFSGRGVDASKIVQLVPAG